MADVAIKNFTRQNLKAWAGLPFVKIAEEMLPGWDISLVFVGATRARTLNKQLRNKDYIPNVLSYEVGAKSGEIIICPSEAQKQAPAYNLPPTAFYLYLFIHGILHLKGWAHGAKMEACEQKLLSLYGTANSDRHRHRHVPGENGRSRRTLR